MGLTDGKICRVGIRVDANEKIATGHLVRMITIAKKLRQKGAYCIFLMAEDCEVNRLIQNDFEYIILNSNWQRLDDEIPLLRKLILCEHLDALIVDSYYANVSFLNTLDEIVPVIYMDDQEKEIYDVSMVIHYGIGADSPIYMKRYETSRTKVLAGMKFCPLREEFSELPNCTMEQRRKRIMITSGGTDPYDLEFQILYEFLNDDFFDSFAFDVIVGAMSPFLDKLKKIEAEHPTRITVHKNVTNMSYFMKNNIFAVSASGTTLYELCACGIPTVCFSFADNQLAGALEFNTRKLMQYSGDGRIIGCPERTVSIVKNFLGQADYLACLESISKQMEKEVDGYGVERIAQQILELCH